MNFGNDDGGMVEACAYERSRMHRRRRGWPLSPYRRSFRPDRLGRLAIILLWLGILLSQRIPLAAQATILPATPINLGLEQGQPGQQAFGWQAPHRKGEGVRIDTRHLPHGKRCLVLYRSPNLKGVSVVWLTQSFDARNYRNRRIRFQAAVRTQKNTQVRLLLTVIRTGNWTGFEDDMADRPIRTEQWRYAEVIGDVASDAERIEIGLQMTNDGMAWAGDFTLETLGKSEPIAEEPARPLAEQGLQNVVAFTRLLGLVRHFHPSNGSAQVYWPRFALLSLPTVESARNTAELAQRLQDLFTPIAPTVCVFPTDSPPPPLPGALRSPGGRLPHNVVAWQHFGFGGSDGEEDGYYSSRRIWKVVRGNHLPAGIPRPDSPYQADLGAGVSCLVPIALFADDGGTLPHNEDGIPPHFDLPSLRPTNVWSLQDRTTRLVDVVLLWNILQHFYPYFADIPVDWPAALREALQCAAVAPDDRAFLDTLRRLVAHLHDGHGNVSYASDSDDALPPLLLTWAEDHLVVLQADPLQGGGLQRGDVLTKIDGRTVAAEMAAKARFISAATPQYLRYRLLDGELLRGAAGSRVTLEAQRGAEAPFTVTLQRVRRADALQEPRPPKVAELKHGIYYVDIDRIDARDYREALPRLAQAKGIIFDFRGYPNDLDPDTFFGHLITRPVISAQWYVPIRKYPDQKEVSYAISHWPAIVPLHPYLSAPKVFLIDGRAISYAESCLAIVENYRLGEIVGEATAGTNGNVSRLTLPGGYNIQWTGMQVRKHDGSRHHGVGILPTIPTHSTIRGIAEGRDEILERAISLFNGSSQ